MRQIVGFVEVKGVASDGDPRGYARRVRTYRQNP